MAICKECGRDMLTADGCGVAFVTVNGKRYERVKYGAAADLFPRQYGRCGDCGARHGHYHHVRNLTTFSGVTVKHALYVGTSLLHASVMWNEHGGTVCEHGHTRHH